MRRQTPIAHQLYAYLFPNPSTSDPPSFSAHLARNLVPEVRIEVATFYGDLNSVEARYPGLNYCHPPHRMRLGRFKHHKRLFEAFDTLGLTYNEIQEFCCWEGTRWARERYEKDEGIKVLDTTGDEIGPYVDRRGRCGADEKRRKSITRKTDISVVVEHATSVSNRQMSIREEEDEIMSDAESEVANDSGVEQDVDEEDVDTPTEAAAMQEHLSELERRRNQSISRRMIAAYQSGQRYNPAINQRIEQLLKEASERGTPVAELDVLSYINQHHTTGYVALASGRTPAVSNAVVPRAAA